MTFEQAIAPFSDLERGQIEERLRLLASHSTLGLQARMNIRLESRLCQEAWTSLFDSLLATKCDLVDIKKTISRTFRSWLLKGPQILLGCPVVFGRAVTVDRFCEMLITLGYFATSMAARRSVRSLLSRPTGKIPQGWSRRDLGRFLMWSTFHPDLVGNPFDGLPAESDTIRGHLGLALNDRGLPLLLLEFTLVPSQALRFPTVAEAYAGDDWSYFFRTSLPNDSHGLTLPWPEPSGMVPRPEVVHAIIQGDRLIGVRECL
jgi:hypothetical protein